MLPGLSGASFSALTTALTRLLNAEYQCQVSSVINFFCVAPVLLACLILYMAHCIRPISQIRIYFPL